MNDFKLFRYGDDGALEIAPHSAQMERNLQYLIEKHMESFLGITLLAHEYRTGKTHRGFIDSLAIDENNCPVILEYKRRLDENVITQGLYYLDWLLDHQAQFVLLARKKLGDDRAFNIEFSGTRVICVASSFSRYDELAIMQIDRNIELIRYKFFGDDLIMLEMLNTALSALTASGVRVPANGDAPDSSGTEVGMPPAMQARLRSMSSGAEKLYLDLLSFAECLGEDVNVKFLKHYVALSRLKNFASIQPLKNSLKLWLNLDPGQIALEDGFSRDVSLVGHVGSGNLELDVHDESGLSRAQALIELAYQQN